MVLIWVLVLLGKRTMKLEHSLQGTLLAAMGGKALKHLGVKRLQFADYNKLKARVLEILAEYYRLFAVPAVLHSKESFGDLDVLVSGAVGTRDPTLDPRFDSTGRVVSGNVTSLEVDSFQVQFPLEAITIIFSVSRLYCRLMHS